MKRDGEWIEALARDVVASLDGGGDDLALLDVVEEDRTAETAQAMEFLGLPAREPGPWWRVTVLAQGQPVSVGVPGDLEPMMVAVQLAGTWQDEMALISGGRAVPACMDGHPHPMAVVADDVSAWWACPNDRAVPRRLIWPPSRSTP